MPILRKAETDGLAFPYRDGQSPQGCSTNNSTVYAIQSISVPVLFTAMGAHYLIRDNERHFDMAKSKDKDFVVIEGATHSNFSGCTPCEKTPGQYSNTVKNLFDYVAKWMNDRY